MSLKSISKKPLVRTGAGIATLGVAAALMFTSVSGADFSASDTGDVSVSTATLSVGLSDGVGSQGTFDLDFVNLKPGETKSQTIVVQNTGSIAADVSLGNPISNIVLPQGLTTADLAKLTVAIPGYQNPVAITSLPASINLGSLVAGQSRSYTVQIGLASNAGNEWQGKTLGATATVTLNQR